MTELPGRHARPRASAAALDRGRHLELHQAREASRSSTSISPRTASATARWATRTSRSRSRAAPRRSTRSSPSSRPPGCPSAPAGPWTTSPRMRSSGCAPPATCERDRPMPDQRDRQLKIVIVGHVDHGKSTLVGRLIHETGSLPDGKLEAIKAMSERRGMPFEWAFLMDAIQAERDQGITIDTTQIRFHTAERDLRHHRRAGPQGVPEEHGDRRRRRRGGAAADRRRTRACRSSRAGTAICCTCWACGRSRCWSTRWTWSAIRPTRFGQVAEEYRDLPARAGRRRADNRIVPISRPRGRQHAARVRAMPWYQGPTLLQALDALRLPVPPTERPLRLPVQDVYKFDQRRIIAGRIESGRLQVGDRWCSRRQQDRAASASIEAWQRARAPERGRGRAVDRHHADRADLRRARRRGEPPRAARRSRATCSGRACSGSGASRSRSAAATRSSSARWRPPVTRRARSSASSTPPTSRRKAGRQDRAQRRRRGRPAHQARLLPLDEHARTRSPAASCWSRATQIVGGGIVDHARAIPTSASRPRCDRPTSRAVGHASPARTAATRNGHAGGVLWFTGLSGAGKITLAWSSSASCSPRATRSTCSTATTCATA